MISLSNVIKPLFYTTLDEFKTVEGARLPQAPGAAPEDGVDEEEKLELLELKAMKERILLDAEQSADQMLHDTVAETNAMREQTQQEIDQWWSERRLQDEQVTEEARLSGLEQGFREGAMQAETAVREQYHDTLKEAQAVLEQAYELKQRIILEAEPFLIELSTAIAEKIIDRQLTIDPEWIVKMTQDVLARRREKGTITLCVAPAHFAYLQDAREEFLLSIDSQAELQIIPDASVTDHGCVVRSAFGSIDARIDTQLTEIKAALRQIALRGEETEAT
ncbi:MAG: flagellar assembly protein FliH [Cohnella sp.]|nr:flagellar assembly protein FliH [Cohnella sp.]